MSWFNLKWHERYKTISELAEYVFSTECNSPGGIVSFLEHPELYKLESWKVANKIPPFYHKGMYSKYEKSPKLHKDLANDIECLAILAKYLVEKEGYTERELLFFLRDPTRFKKEWDKCKPMKLCSELEKDMNRLSKINIEKERIKG